MMILNTPFVKIYQVQNELQVQITAKDGSIIEHEPFKNDAEGLVNALSIATEICAGKFYLRKVIQTPSGRDNLAIDFQKKGKIK